MVLVFVGLFFFYVLGVVVRRGYGIGVVVHNASQETLRQVSIKIESIGDRGGRYDLPDLRPGDRRRIFVRSVTESHINLEFIDSNNRQHVETVYGYTEAGYCGTATATFFRVTRSHRVTPFPLLHVGKVGSTCSSATA